MNEKDLSLKKALDDMLSKSHWDKRLKAISLKDDWEKIMGNTIHKYTKNLNLYNKKLIIQTDIAPLKNELMLNRKSIIEKVNTFYGKEIVTEVEIS